MSEDETKQLTDRQLLELILARLQKVEAFVDDRSRDTRPLLDRLHKKTAELLLDVRDVKHRLDNIETILRGVAFDGIETRDRIRELDRRITDLERPGS